MNQLKMTSGIVAFLALLSACETLEPKTGIEIENTSRRPVEAELSRCELGPQGPPGRVIVERVNVGSGRRRVIRAEPGCWHVSIQVEGDSESEGGVEFVLMEDSVHTVVY